MIRLVRCLAILLLAIALVANIAPSFAMAFPAASAGPAQAAPQPGHHHGGMPIDHADRGANVQAGHTDCPGHADNPAGHSNDDGACKKCCGVCITASMMPVVTAPGISLVAARSSFSALSNTLTPHGPPSDPGIPKPLT